MTTYLNFSKMQALGNDFMVINTIFQHFIPDKDKIKAWSDRHFGIGFDQLLIIEAPRDPSHDYFYRIFNASGDEVAQCGNGARAAAIYIHKHIAAQKNLILKTYKTQIELHLLADDEVELSIPAPNFSASSIPILSSKDAKTYELDGIHFHAVNVGNPHAVILINSVQELNEMSIEAMGRHLENHAFFPEKTNVNFMAFSSKHDLHLRVWERNCGETLACGSGALASAACAHRFHHLDSEILIHLRGGCLKVTWPDIHGPIHQVGPAVEVFEGRIAIP